MCDLIQSLFCIIFLGMHPPENLTANPFLKLTKAQVSFIPTFVCYLLRFYIQGLKHDGLSFCRGLVSPRFHVPIVSTTLWAGCPHPPLHPQIMHFSSPPVSHHWFSIKHLSSKRAALCPASAASWRTRNTVLYFACW